MQAEVEETGWLQTMKIQTRREMAFVVPPFPASMNRPDHDFHSKNRTFHPPQVCRPGCQDHSGSWHARWNVVTFLILDCPQVCFWYLDPTIQMFSSTPLSWLKEIFIEVEEMIGSFWGRAYLSLLEGTVDRLVCSNCQLQSISPLRGLTHFPHVHRGHPPLSLQWESLHSEGIPVLSAWGLNDWEWQIVIHP